MELLRWQNLNLPVYDADQVLTMLREDDIPYHQQTMVRKATIVTPFDTLAETLTFTEKEFKRLEDCVGVAAFVIPHTFGIYPHKSATQPVYDPNKGILPKGYKLAAEVPIYPKKPEDEIHINNYPLLIRGVMSFRNQGYDRVLRLGDIRNDQFIAVEQPDTVDPLWAMVDIEPRIAWTR